MNYLGSKTLETKRLLLHKTEQRDLKELWNILCLESVNKYYLTTKLNFDWEKEKIWQQKKLEEANNPDIFRWTIELTDTHEIIGQIDLHPKNDEDDSYQDPTIRGLGWFLDPNFQKQGYAYEAALEVLKYMFLEVEITKIETGAAVENPSSWKLMERLGFKDLNRTHKGKYTFVEEEVECKEYELTKKDFLKELFRKEKLHITIDIDKDPYIKHISDDPILNLTGESGSGKSTAANKYKDNTDCIIIDTDQVFGNHTKNKYAEELSNYLKNKYENLDFIKDFDIFYKETLEYFKDSGKFLIIDSAQLRYLKDLTLLKGDLTVLRTCVNTCYERCIARYKEKKKDATFEEIAAFSTKKKRMYSWYHYLNKFLDRVDKMGEENK